MRSPLQIAASLLELDAELDRPGRTPAMWFVREDLRQARAALDPYEAASVIFAVDAPVPTILTLANRARALRDELDVLITTTPSQELVLTHLAPAHRALSSAVTMLLVQARYSERAAPAPVQAVAA